MTDAFPIYLKTGVTASDTAIATALTTASAYVTNSRATLNQNNISVLEVPVCFDEELKLSVAGANALITAISAITTIAKVTDSSSGRLRWNYGKGVYALGYSYTSSNDAAYIKNITNVVWK